jgi:hypothetical protein
MVHAFTHHIRRLDLDDGFRMLIGADQSGRLLEAASSPAPMANDHRPRDARPSQVPEVINMPRTTQEILDHADELAKRFEDYEPRSEDEVTTPEILLRRAVQQRADGERRVRDAVAAARKEGMSWRSIGETLGTSAQAAQKRYADASA